MAKNWYPVIDYGKCIGCLQCLNFCPHGVFEKGPGDRPKVTRPDNCVEFCKGCGRLCDQKAISYFGDRK